MSVNRYFFKAFILPSVAVIVLYCILIFGFLLPSQYYELIELKKNSLKEMMDVAESIITSYYSKVQSREIDESFAKQKAAIDLGRIRYGKDRKDYFWINDTHPRMIMHPYRKDLEGTDLTEFTDKKNVKIFKVFVDEVKKNGDGYLFYYWQWMDNSKKVIPKLSYVRGFKPWNWVIGSGVYIEDTKKEIAAKVQLNVLMTVIIAFVISVLLYRNIKSSRYLNRLRNNAEKDLSDSRDRYKALVNASGEGIVFISNGKISYANLFFLQLSGYSSSELETNRLELFFIDHEKIAGFSHDASTESTFETSIICKNGNQKPVVCTLSPFELNDQSGLICTIKNISAEMLHSVEKTKSILISDFHKDYSFLFRQIKDFMKPAICSVQHSPVKKMVSTFTDNQTDAAIVVSEKQEILGIVTNRDLITRIPPDTDTSKIPVFEIMTSPVQSIHLKSQIFEAINQMQKFNITHLVIKDDNHRPVGILHGRDILHNQSFLTTTIMGSVNTSSNVSALRENYKKIIVLATSLVDSGVSVENMQAAFTTINRLMIRKAWDLASGECGVPDTPYSLLLSGSLGRGEQTLNSDYDNILIFSANRDTDILRKQFSEAAQLTAEMIEETGIPPCEGGVTASNPGYCLSLEEFTTKVDTWITEPSPQVFLALNEFLDIYCVAGDNTIESSIIEYIQNSINSSPQFKTFFARDVLQKKIPLDPFGNIQKKTAAIDHNMNLKEAILPLVNSIRFYSAIHALKERSTTGRITRLSQIGVLSQRDMQTLLESFHFLQTLLIRNQITSQQEPNIIKIEQLSELERIMLKRSLTRIQSFISRIGFDFNIRD